MVKAGASTIHLLSDGILKCDGGAVFGQVPKVLWEQQIKPDRWNRVSLGLNCLLIRTEHENVLVDTGVGRKETGKLKEVYGLSSSKLSKALKEVGLSAKDIDKVILTHLHFDHSGGCTKIDRSGGCIPVFPRATYYVQKACWDDALAPNERGKEAHNMEDYSCLKDAGQLELVEGDAEILPGLWVKETGGHCSGHQVVKLDYGSEKVVFLGDVIPTPHHLNLSYIAAHDQYPEDTLEIKREILAQAAKDGWLVVFSHGSEERAGYLEKRNGDIKLRPVSI